jgi:hypothetical protein
VQSVGVGGIVVLEVKVFPVIDAVTLEKLSDFHRIVTKQPIGSV